MRKITLKIMLIAFCMCLAAGGTSLARAATSGIVPVIAEVSVLNGMTVNISRISGTTWTLLGSNTLMDFGTLTYDNSAGIFKGAYYFAVDVGILNNAGSWSLQHTPSSIYNITTGNTAQNLNNNINVSFMNQINDTNSSAIAKVSFANSNKTVTNSDISLGGWLRIYYGIGTGSGDNTGVTPILASQVAGTYQGAATLTVTP